MAVRRITALSPAKINISLRIRGRRGHLHTISSVMTLLNFADQISVSLRNDGKLQRQWSHGQVSDDADLAMRAAALFQAESGSPFGADIIIHKKIPIGGGLGGGSSNAASVLLMLNKLWAVDWQRRQLMEIALKLGSDVPFFIYGKSARATGVGEKLRAVQLPPQHYLLLFSEVTSSTAAVYAEYSRLTSLAANDNKRGVDAQAEIKKAESLINNKNDLAAAAFSLYPAIATAAQLLQQVTGQALLSGSGACVYAIFADAAAAKRAQKKLPTICRSAVAATLPTHPFYN